MELLHAAAILLAGVAAGTINAVVGSGSLVTFPTLLAFGYPPVTANVSNTIGLVPGNVSSVWGYRRELEGQRSRVVRLGAASLVGATVGAVLLLVLPESAFAAIVPALIALGVVLVAFGPRISAWVSRRHAEVPPHGHWWVWPAVLLTGVYGGYFGAAQGVILLAVLGIGVADGLQRLNAVKNVLGGLANFASGALFIVVADVDWWVVLLIAIGSTIGGQLGSSVGRRLPPQVFRAVIVVVGLVALAAFFVG